MKAAEKKAEELWGTYYMLSEEMLKFIAREDVDMFLQLLEQRSSIQQLIEDKADDGWTKTPAGQEMYQKLKSVDMQLQYKARLWLNKSKQQNQAVKVYDTLGANPAGHLFNQKF